MDDQSSLYFQYQFLKIHIMMQKTFEKSVTCLYEFINYIESAVFQVDCRLIQRDPTHSPTVNFHLISQGYRNVAEMVWPERVEVYSAYPNKTSLGSLSLMHMCSCLCVRCCQIWNKRYRCPTGVYTCDSFRKTEYPCLSFNKIFIDMKGSYF